MTNQDDGNASGSTRFVSCRQFDAFKAILDPCKNKYEDFEHEVVVSFSELRFLYSNIIRNIL